MSAVLTPPSPGRPGPGDVRKRLITVVLVLAYVLVLGGGAAYNVTVYLEQDDLQQQIAGHDRELSMAEQIRTNTAAEQARQVELLARGDEIFTLLPDMAAVPVVVGQLEDIATALGGELTDMQYQAPVWDGAHGVVTLQLAVAGPFDALAKYLESVAVSVPTLYWESFDLQPLDDSGQDLLLFAKVRLDVHRGRPVTAAPWRDDLVRLVEATAAVNPFGPRLSLILLEYEPTADDWMP